jgi:hypothetical protein
MYHRGMGSPSIVPAVAPEYRDKVGGVIAGGNILNVWVVLLIIVKCVTNAINIPCLGTAIEDICRVFMVADPSEVLSYRMAFLTQCVYHVVRAHFVRHSSCSGIFDGLLPSPILFGHDALVYDLV